MSDPVPATRQHRTDLGTKVKSDATLIRVETDTGLSGLGAALGTPPVVAAIVEHELAPDIVGEDPMFSERIFIAFRARHVRPFDFLILAFIFSCSHPVMKPVCEMSGIPLMPVPLQSASAPGNATRKR